MNLKLPNCISIFLLLSLNVSGGVIKGIITASGTGNPLTGANVMIEGTHMGAATNNNGFYIIENLPPGKYIVQASFIVYGTWTDSVRIKKQNEIIELNITLKSPVVDLSSVSTPQLEIYHKKFQEANKIRPVMWVNY